MFQSPFTVENGGTIPQHKERWRSDVTDGDDPEWEQWELRATVLFVSAVEGLECA